MDSIRQPGTDSVLFFANDVVITITKTSRRINENILCRSDPKLIGRSRCGGIGMRRFPFAPKNAVHG